MQVAKIRPKNQNHGALITHDDVDCRGIHSALVAVIAESVLVIALRNSERRRRNSEHRKEEIEDSGRGKYVIERAKGENRKRRNITHRNEVRYVRGASVDSKRRVTAKSYENCKRQHRRSNYTEF